MLSAKGRSSGHRLDIGDVAAQDAGRAIALVRGAEGEVTDHIGPGEGVAGAPHLEDTIAGADPEGLHHGRLIRGGPVRPEGSGPGSGHADPASLGGEPARVHLENPLLRGPGS